MTDLKQEKALSEIRGDAEKGISVAKSIEKLFHLGISITASIRIIKIAYRLSLADAKDRVAGHSVWGSLVKKVQPYHDDLIKYFNSAA
ncbi:MAG: hypothetical protein HC887_10425 [Desulfobacteraceae bacterium]|nr:hypothetical protein [Desulfobacteraceae bacterium]